jgi:hypothetical protein
MTCPVCVSDLYNSGHSDPGCPGDGMGCQECGWGCDLDFSEDGTCAAMQESV